MATSSMLDAFLSEILNSVRAKDGNRITDLIQLDFENMKPSRQKPYADLNTELNRKYPAGNDSGLSDYCKQFLPQDEFGSFHPSFTESIIQYFRYLRDFARTDNQSRARQIRQLTSQCIAALGDSKYGVIMIPIVLSFSRVLARIATNLDRNPTPPQTNTSTGAGDADALNDTKVSFVESTANVLRDSFIKCLAGSPGASRASKPAPDDKRYGIYLTANSCLKLLFQCRKIRNAQQMFASIDAQSPLLSYYPAAQRVTYLYYLGRYHFANNHFLRAHLALQSAYDQCHREAIKHRRLILIYLIAANICLGRFPSLQLMSRPEARDLGKRFVPLMKIIRSGDLTALEDHLELTVNNKDAQWFLQKSILLQLRNRCEVLVWRSLIRKVFIISGYKGEDKKIPFLRLSYVRHAAQWVVRRKRSSGMIFGASFGSSMTTNSKQPYIDADFAELNSAISETGFDPETGLYHDDMADHAASHSFLQEHAQHEQGPSMDEVESIFLSLIQQGLLRGFVLHTSGNPRFAIPGSQAAGGPVLRGFPNVWRVVAQKARDGDGESIPGWVKDEMILGNGSLGSGGASGGRVIRLTSARPVGVAS